MEPTEYLEVAGREFRDRLTAIGNDQWELPTPCEQWTVRDLVGHLVGGNQMAVSLLAGATAAESIGKLGGDLLGSDSLGAYDRSLHEQAEAFGEPGALERTCHHPVGDVPGGQLLGFRMADLVIHAWDLARAIGADESLDADVVAGAWAAMEPRLTFIATSGRFGSGPSGSLPDGAPIQDRLLDASGRRP
jgi:uncharacterized protein (TIGR03086 family)